MRLRSHDKNVTAASPNDAQMGSIGLAVVGAAAIALLSTLAVNAIG
jgi:hypothetical protein